MTGDKYDWDVDPGVGELSLEIKAAYSRKSYIDNQTIGTAGRVSQAERSRRIQPNRIISHRTQQKLDKNPHRSVVVNDNNSRSCCCGIILHERRITKGGVFGQRSVVSLISKGSRGGAVNPDDVRPPTTNLTTAQTACHHLDADQLMSAIASAHRRLLGPNRRTTVRWPTVAFREEADVRRLFKTTTIIDPHQ